MDNFNFLAELSQNLEKFALIWLTFALPEPILFIVKIRILDDGQCGKLVFV